MAHRKPTAICMAILVAVVAAMVVFPDMAMAVASSGYSSLIQQLHHAYYFIGWMDIKSGLANVQQPATIATMQ